MRYSTVTRLERIAKQMGASPLERKMATILCQINGEQDAIDFLRKVEHKHLSEEARLLRLRDGLK
jgi:ribosomal protein L22